MCIRYLIAYLHSPTYISIEYRFLFFIPNNLWGFWHYRLEKGWYHVMSHQPHLRQLAQMQTRRNVLSLSPLRLIHPSTTTTSNISLELPPHIQYQKAKSNLMNKG